MKSRTTLSKSETRKISLILLYLAIVFGIVIGSILFSVSESKFVSSEFVMQYISPFELKGSLLDFFGYSVLSYSLFVISFFILGFCTFGQIMSVILIVFRGIGIGVSVSSMYALMGKKAILAAGYSGNIASGMEYREFTPFASDQNNCRRYDSGMLPFDGGNLPGMYIMRPDTDEQSIF